VFRAVNDTASNPQLNRELLDEAVQPATFEFDDQANHDRTL
jgi:hypothetical protein